MMEQLVRKLQVCGIRFIITQSNELDLVPFEHELSSSTGPGKLLLVGVRDFADLRPKIRQTLAPFFVDLRA